MTVPNLMSNFRKREIETALPIAYKLIDDAVKLSVMMNGPQSTWEYNMSIELAEKYFIPYLKVGKICGAGTGGKGQLKAKGCFKDPGDYERVDGQPTNGTGNGGSNGIWYHLNGTIPTQGGYSSEWFSTMVLANGMHLGIWGHDVEEYRRYNGILFVVDVNGKRGPTTLGHDVFTFKFNYNTNKLEIGGRNNNNHLTAGDCENPTGLGYSCAAVLQQNGWKFPEDYPVKKW